MIMPLDHGRLLAASAWADDAAPGTRRLAYFTKLWLIFIPLITLTSEAKFFLGHALIWGVLISLLSTRASKGAR
jgi:hypothetical protein